MFSRNASSLDKSIFSPAVLSLLGLSVALGNSSARAFIPIQPASVAWGAATNISGDTDVNTNGALVAAYHFGTTGVTPTTVNGVLFTPVAITGNPTTFGTFTLAESPATLSGTNSIGSNAAPFTGLSSSYQALLTSGAYSSESAAITLTMGGLTTGQQYQFEWWNSISNSSSNLGAPSNYTTTATAGTSVTLNPDTGAQNGGVGQYAIGTFTATAASNTISFSGTPVGPEINAFELRALPVPEPTSLGLLGIGATVLLGRRRRAN